MIRLLYPGTSGYRPLTTRIERLTRKGSRMPASLDRPGPPGRWGCGFASFAPPRPGFELRISLESYLCLRIQAEQYIETFRFISFRDDVAKREGRRLLGAGLTHLGAATGHELDKGAEGGAIKSLLILSLLPQSAHLDSNRSWYRRQLRTHSRAASSTGGRRSSQRIS